MRRCLRCRLHGLIPDITDIDPHYVKNTSAYQLLSKYHLWNLGPGCHAGRLEELLILNRPCHPGEDVKEYWQAWKKVESTKEIETKATKAGVIWFVDEDEVVQRILEVISRDEIAMAVKYQEARCVCKVFHQVSHCSDLSGVVLPRTPCVNNNQVEPSYLVPWETLSCSAWNVGWSIFFCLDAAWLNGFVVPAVALLSATTKWKSRKITGYLQSPGECSKGGLFLGRSVQGLVGNAESTHVYRPKGRHRFFQMLEIAAIS